VARLCATRARAAVAAGAKDRLSHVRVERCGNVRGAPFHL
jgi:hypothetical protein